jgi:hypothetical protein
MSEKGNEMSKEETSATTSRRASKQKDASVTRDRSEMSVELRVKELENTVKALTERMNDVDYDIEDMAKKLDSLEIPKGDFISASDLRRFLSGIGEAEKGKK